MNEFRDRAIKTIQMKHRGEKQTSKPSTSELQDNFKQTSTRVLEVPKGKEGKVMEQRLEINSPHSFQLDENYKSTDPGNSMTPKKHKENYVFSQF